jgi:hypothetical protein
MAQEMKQAEPIDMIIKAYIQKHGRDYNQLNQKACYSISVT